MNVIVGVADSKVRSDVSDVLVAYALGSCIAISIYDPAVHMGGLLHFMLADAPTATAHADKTVHIRRICWRAFRGTGTRERNAIGE